MGISLKGIVDDVSPEGGQGSPVAGAQTRCSATGLLAAGLVDAAPRPRRSVKAAAEAYRNAWGALRRGMIKTSKHPTNRSETGSETMKISRTLAGAAFASIALLSAATAWAKDRDKNVKIGVLTDLTSLFSDISGSGSVIAAQMAVEDSGLSGKGWTVTVVAADHQNKPEIGSVVARRWFDVDGVDAIADLPNSAVGLAVNGLVRDNNKVLLGSGTTSTAFTNAQCSPNTIVWTFDTYMLAHAVGSSITAAGGSSWFFLAVDYVFGKSLAKETGDVVQVSGGTVVGEVRHPLNTSDFSSFILQAQASKAKVVALANGGGDTINAIKQGVEFGLTAGGQRVVPLVLFITDVHSLGLQVAQGLTFAEAFYWDLNDMTRSFSSRFMERSKNRAPPTSVQAGVYSSVRHYLKTLENLGGNPHDGALVVSKMKALPVDDPLFGKGEIRIDGRTVHPAYVFQVKTPAESRGPWDYYKLIATIPGDVAFKPLSESECPLVTK